MAVKYLDYVGGNDSNDGSSFALRVKTITAGLTAARIAPGDECRIMRSGNPTSLGISATWTNKSATVTLSSAKNALITNCDSAWTASANVTCTADTGIYRTSTGSSKNAIAAGFTTGLAAFFATGTLNLSAYQGITLWLRVSAALAASTLSIRLCSDAAGVTTVDTLALPAVSQANQWVPVYINKGSALGASIQSIALYADIDPGAIDVYLDNISTVLAAGNDALNLQSLIGKNTGSELFWALRQINGTALTIDITPAITPSDVSRGYSGTTESVTTYKRETTKTDLVAAAGTVVAAIQDSGSAGSLITFSGGWNTTDMTTQDGDTYFDGQSGLGLGIDTNNQNFIKMDKLYCLRYDTGFRIDGDNQDHGSIFGGHCYQYGMNLNNPQTMTATELSVWGCYFGGFTQTLGSDWTITTMRSLSCGIGTGSGWIVFSGASTGNWSITTLTINNSAFYGLTITANSAPNVVRIGTLTCRDNGQSGFFPNTAVNDWRITTAVLSANGAAGFRSGALRGSLFMGAVTAADNTNYGLDLSEISQDVNVDIQSLTTSGNGTASIIYGILCGVIHILKSSLAEATKLVGTSGGVANGRLSFRKYNNTADDHRSFLVAAGTGGAGLGTIFSETSVRHTASGLAWKMSPLTTTYITSNSPMVMSLGKILCNASALVTVKVWLRRTNTGLTGTLRIRGGQITGVDNDVTDSIGAAADTWEEQTITFTPTEVGVVEIEVLCYGGTTYSLYVDDLSVSQA